VRWRQRWDYGAGFDFGCLAAGVAAILHNVLMVEVALWWLLGMTP